MLQVLKKKAANLNLKPKVSEGNMTNFKLNKKFSLIIIPFRAFLHNLTTEDQIKTLRIIKKHLTSNGRFILNFFLPSAEAIVENYGRIQKRTIKTDKEKFILMEKPYFIDEPNQIIEVSNTLTKNKKSVFKGRFRLSLIYKKEFELLLRLAGFKKWKVYGGFDYPPLKSSKQEMVWIIQN